MDSISTSTLLIVLVILILLSAFFSSSETGLMSLNRYKLRHLAQTKHKAARRVEKLLARPDRLLGLILIGNNLVNILASAIATIVCIRLFGDLGVAIATFGLTLVVLVLARGRSRRQEDARHVNLFILLLILVACLLLYYRG